MTEIHSRVFRLLERTANESKNPVVVIEAAYFDLNDALAADRVEHIHDALTLADYISQEFKGQFALELVAFVNDITIDSDICGIEACTSNGPGRNSWQESVQKLVVSRLELAGAPHLEPYTFLMRTTRNRATRSLKKALKRGTDDGIGVIEKHESDFVYDVFAETGDKSILLASRAQDSPVFMPRCTAIMGQHYFDIFQHVESRFANVDHLLIFDFNRLTEAARVSLGAEASFVLHQWPESLTVNLANCIYRPGSDDVGQVVVTSGP